VSDFTALVLLSSFNGARYIRDQIESIRAQTFRDWRLLIRDDGSSDETSSIVRTLSAQDGRIEILSDHSGNVGAYPSFGLLLLAAAKTSALYVFLSDQDDVWIPTKMAEQIETVRRAEKSLGVSHPILAHTDLEVVDEKLQPIHPSFRQYQGFSHDREHPLETLLIHNGIMGCTIAINRALLDVAVPLPAGLHHDWWLGLCAAATGTIISTGEKTVRYRQHGSNTVGAHARRAFLPEVARHPLNFISKSLAAFDVGVRQSAELTGRLADRALGDATMRFRVDRYTEAFGSQPFLARIGALRQSGAKPRRRLSRILLLGIVGLFPHWKAKRQG